MEKRRLGRIDHMSSVVILGTAALGSSDQNEANAALDLALAQGINHIDVAPQYGNAQQVVGPWLASRREQFFLGCKTLERTHEAAWADLQNSLKLLHTDVIDLYQFHAITTMNELDQVLQPGGALEAFRTAREQGIVRYLGITGHGMQAPTVQRAALERFDLDCVMFPLNPRLYADANYRLETERLLRLCQERDVGVQIIKSVAKAPWGDREKMYNCWYEPYTSDESVAASIYFALSQPGVVGVASAGDVRLLPVFIRAAENMRTLDEAEQTALIAARADDTLIF